MTKILITLLLAIFVITKSDAQELASKKIASEKYLSEAVSFLNAVKSKELSDPSFTLVNTPKYSCFTYTVDDSVTFTKEEMKQIADEIEFPNISSWKSILPSKIRFLDEAYINAHSKLVKNPKRETKFFNKKFGGCYHHFSAPIFLRGYTFCLFYVDKICAAGQSSGELQVFEKVDGVWKQLTSRCEWTE
ncbi:MAG: hypothetical protein V4663_00725 [Bacteroidota bacterium]